MSGYLLSRGSIYLAERPLTLYPKWRSEKMAAFIEAISYNSWAYMIFLGVVIGIIYVILFLLVKMDIKKTKAKGA
jgi:hypothetical protein